MKFSIITVCYNSAATIRDTLESVLSQTHPDTEYIVIDGNSSDGTQAIIAEYMHRIAYYTSEPDDGIYDAMNKGIRCATGDVIGILNSDDIYMDENVISIVAKQFEKEPSDVVFGDLVYVRPGNDQRIVRYYSAKRFKPWKLRFGWMPPHPATFVRKSVYDEIGLYKTDYKIAADFELILRALYCQRSQYQRINATLVKMRTGGASTKSLKSNWILNTEIVRACKSYGLYTNLLLILLKTPWKLVELISVRRDIRGKKPQA